MKISLNDLKKKSDLKDARAWPFTAPEAEAMKTLIECLRMAMEALEDNRNHWHAPEHPSDGCTACAALSKIKDRISE